MSVVKCGAIEGFLREYCEGYLFKIIRGDLVVETMMQERSNISYFEFENT